MGGENLSTLSWTPFAVQITWNSSFILRVYQHNIIRNMHTNIARILFNVYTIMVSGNVCLSVTDEGSRRLPKCLDNCDFSG